MPEFKTFDEFYAVYLTAHRDPWNRRIHLLGWVIGAAMGLYALVIGPLWWLLGAPAAGLLAIAIGHGLIEPTHAVEFKYPLRTALANLRMFADMARGRLPR
jgi:hypothetical protein